MHKGKIVCEISNQRIIECETCGFKHIDPIPSDDKIDVFYKQTYFDQIRQGLKGRNLKHFLDGGDEADKEAQWLRSTLYKDVHDFLCNHIKSGKKNLCDIGCGSANFLKYMNQRGWQCIGIEPSDNSNYEFNRVKIFNTTFEGFLTKYPEYQNSFAAVTLFGVLEHTTHPKKMMDGVKSLIKPEGILFVNVPNDFSSFQQAAMQNLNITPWWVSTPDHINYFSMHSLEKFLESQGFLILEKTTDFPMELFLLMGDDYTKDPNLGSICHQKRKIFEQSIPSHLRRSIYTCLAHQSVGRNCMVYATLKKSNE